MLLFIAFTLPLTPYWSKYLVAKPNIRGKGNYSSHSRKHFQVTYQTNNNPIFHWPSVSLCISNYNTHFAMSHAALKYYFFTYMSPVNLHNILLWIYLEMNSLLILNNSASDEQLRKNRTEVQISLLWMSALKMRMRRKGMIWQHFAMCTQKAFIAWATQKASTSTYCARATPPTAPHTASRPRDK